MIDERHLSPNYIVVSPIIASLQYNESFFGHDVLHFCGGSIISENWIVTTAQCATELEKEELQVRVGSKYYYEGGQIHLVADILVHPNYSEAHNDFDVGLLRLASNITFDNQTLPIRLPPPDMEIANEEMIAVVGWGAIKNLGNFSGEIRSTKVMKIDNDKCRLVYGNFSVTDRMFCTNVDGAGPCMGDSGSPALAKNLIVGIVSWSHKCAEAEYPSVFVNVPIISGWITNVTGVSSTSRMTYSAGLLILAILLGLT
ncbi:trypsin-7 [Orussus abietinus]|uniref:trypsin-7 n=1 Tax=Orussus abietinus TaxID=222816 RepID=UPI00062610F2|nr:trypsin-7 [Orussus abietinus]